jgi:integrase
MSNQARVSNGLLYGDSASVQAVTRVNAEQASKRTMRRPTRLPFRGRLIRLGEVSIAIRSAAAPGYWRQHVHKESARNTGSPKAIRMPPRFLAHVRRWKRRQLANAFLIEWQGEPVKRLNKAFRSVRRAAGLGPDVTPHTLRHTAITWQAQLGVPPHEICGFFGITMEMFERVYGHHHPDYQQNAVNALNRPRMIPERYNATKRKQTGSNVVKLA